MTGTAARPHLEEPVASLDLPSVAKTSPTPRRYTVRSDLVQADRTEATNQQAVTFVETVHQAPGTHFLEFSGEIPPAAPQNRVIVPAPAGASLSGRITLQGQPPPEKALPLDPLCSQLWVNQPAPVTRFFVVSKEGGLADVFVYIKSGLQRKPSPPREAVVLDQIRCEFVPYVLGLQTRQLLLIKNSDPFLHNVHITPSVENGNKGSNAAQMAGAPPFQYQFDYPELFLRVKCDVHFWMFAYIGVQDHPYFAVTGQDGRFEIGGVPPGKYTIEAYHRKAGRLTQEVALAANDVVQIDFVFELEASAF